MSDIKRNEEIIDILYSFKDIIRVSILDHLYTRTREGSSFKEIAREIGIGPTTAAYHLKVLVKVGFIEKRFRNEESRRDYSFYHLTPKGERAYITAMGMHKEIRSGMIEDRPEELPDIQITHMRYGPRCISLERPQE